MNFLPVPKILSWNHSLDQNYSTDQTILLTSGCSFTASTQQVTTAASWPGFVVDRCRFEKGIDYSYPGAGNEYIGDSIIHHLESIDSKYWDQYLVVIMWSGIDRAEIKMQNNNSQPCLQSTSYSRIALAQVDQASEAKNSFNKILLTYHYLVKRKIRFAFTCYADLFFGPYIPKMDTTKEFDKFLNNKELDVIRNLGWVPSKSLDFLYEYAFINDYLNSGDHFHPPLECNLEWTDNILLPALAEKKLINEIYSNQTRP